MKKILSVLLVLLMLFTATVAFAEGMGVQVIGGENEGFTPISLDDVKLNASVEIPGYAEITPTEYNVWDCVMVRQPGKMDFEYRSTSDGSQWIKKLDAYFYFDLEINCEHHTYKEYPYASNNWVVHHESKSQADYAFLMMDVLNTTNIDVDFTKDCSVKVVFDDNVEYAGWLYQRNLDLNLTTWIDPSDNFAISPYYEGHYVFGCTLPNAVINSKAPLRMEINLGGNEITYNIRK